MRLSTTLAIILIPLNLLAMSSLTDDDLSSFSHPLSLNIGSGPTTVQENDTEEPVDYTGISFYLLNAIKHKGLLDLDPQEYPRSILDDQVEDLPDTFMQGLGNGTEITIQNILIDPITLKDNTKLNDNNTIISAEEASNSASSSSSLSSRSMIYPKGSTNSSNTPYTYTIKSGNVEMRNTFINQTRSTIQPNSWVDIKTR